MSATSTNPTPVAVACRSLRLVRGEREVLFVPTLEILRGETWSFIGPNGAGKSSLLRALAMLDRPAAGELRHFGEPTPRRVPLDLRRRVVLAFQETLLLDRSVVANVSLPLKLRGAKKREALRAATFALELFGAAHLADRRALRLSGGEARRVALARAFAASPELLLLDEPFAALDPPSRELLVGDLRAAIRATGTTCAVVTHDRREAMALADRLGVVIDGRLVQAGPTEEVLHRPATEAVARFVGVENVLPVRVAGHDGEVLRLEAGAVTLLARHAPIASEVALALIRAEEIGLAPPGELSPGRILCTVEAIAPGLNGMEVRLAPLGLRARLPRGNDWGLRPGDQVACEIAPESIGLVAG